MATYTYTNPNFLASEVGLKLDTVGLDKTTHSTMVVTETINGAEHSIIKAGTVYSSGGKLGLVFQDIDVTATSPSRQVPAPLMTAGHFINTTDALPSVVESGTLTSFASQGLFADNFDNATVTRPY